MRPQPELVRAAESAANEIKAAFTLVKHETGARAKGERLWQNTANIDDEDAKAKRPRMDNGEDLSMVQSRRLCGSLVNPWKNSDTLFVCIRDRIFCSTFVGVVLF